MSEIGKTVTLRYTATFDIPITLGSGGFAHIDNVEDALELEQANFEDDPFLYFDMGELDLSVEVVK